MDKAEQSLRWAHMPFCWFYHESAHFCIERKLSKFVLFCRQLEAIIRISESLAKMKLKPFATEADVDEALRLFQVSTLDAAMSGNLAGQ